MASSLSSTAYSVGCGYSQIEQIARAVWVRKFSWAREMAIFTAYFDEAGHPRRKLDQMVVGGSVASVEQWAKLETEWETALQDFGLDTPFHSTDFDTPKNPRYAHLTERQKDELHDRLTGIICVRVNHIHVHVLNILHYEAINGSFLLRESIGAPYAIAARSCINEVQIWRDKYYPDSPPVTIAFEDHAQDKGSLEWVIVRDKLQSPLFREKSQCIALQTADLISYCVRRSRIEGLLLKHRYARAVSRFEQKPGKVTESSLADSEYLPYVLNLRKRDHGLRYTNKVIKKNGVRHALTQFFPKTEKQRIFRRDLEIPPPPKLTEEEIDQRVKDYRAGRIATTP